MNNKTSILKDKSFVFAVRIVKLYEYLTNEKKEYVLSKQLLKSGTSIGANVREAYNGESAQDFIHKLAIAQKEADETHYWLELLLATDILKNTEFESLARDATEILVIVRSIILTKKQNLMKV